MNISCVVLIAGIYLLALSVRSLVEKSWARILFLMQGIVCIAVYFAVGLAFCYCGCLLSIVGELVLAFSLLGLWAGLVLAVVMPKF